ncbi:DNA-binding MarR family transcriptional regulator [Kribbella voronezhensis]|uniref:DNA-binding MarR family transcriptional regulator n=1 Tax=Kribbella voronezhensis TaxID=2512212 RepID=A0A4R7T5B7_9ACTN|nr:MarR family transcriptional regulator [Kribbella voronezhensis]TDU87040.1 DNA-binding MarR family transcriptional regulator [Kribbella voronezhensis]
MISESEEPARLLLELQRATHATLQELTAKLVDLDLSPSEINALGNLSDGRPRTVSELGAAIGIRPTTLTGVLDRLERRGCLTRGVRAGDRRAVLIELTEDGRETADLIAAAIAEIEHQALADLPAEVVGNFRRVLRALAGGGSGE